MLRQHRIKSIPVRAIVFPQPAKLGIAFWDYLGNRIGPADTHTYHHSPTSSAVVISPPDLTTPTFAPATIRLRKPLIYQPESARLPSHREHQTYDFEVSVSIVHGRLCRLRFRRFCGYETRLQGVSAHEMGEKPLDSTTWWVEGVAPVTLSVGVHSPDPNHQPPRHRATHIYYR